MLPEEGNNNLGPAPVGRGVLGRLQSFGLGLTSWSERWIPDAWVVALIVTIPVFIAALIWGDVGPSGAFKAYGHGIWTLLTLMAEFSFAIIVAYAVATSPPVARLLNWLACLPNSDKPRQAILLMAAFSYVTAWINWAAAIVMSAVFVLFIARNNPKVDYRLLAAAAFLGFGTVWNAGLSSSSGLIVATPGNFLVKSHVVDHLIPINETIFSPWNLVMSVVVAVLGTALVVALTPAPEKARTISREYAESLLPDDTRDQVTGPMTPAQRMEHWPGWNILFGAVALGYVVYLVVNKGFSGWTIDSYNLLFLSLALLFHWRPRSFLNACERGVRGAWGILLVFPFFAGMFGMIQLTKLGATLSHFFASITTLHTFAPVVFWYSSILNYFIPSAGAKFALEAPYLVPAGTSHGVSAAATTLAYSWGDLGTALIQPFWAIALLSIVRLKFGDIMGYCGIIWVAYIVLVSAGMFLLPT